MDVLQLVPDILFLENFIYVLVVIGFELAFGNRCNPKISDMHIFFFLLGHNYMLPENIMGQPRSTNFYSLVSYIVRFM